MSGEDSRVQVTLSKIDEEEKDGGHADNNEELEIRDEDPLEMMQREEPSTHSMISRQPQAHANN